jgi:uncharacterized protein YjbJ (UPF0337 family)
MDKGSIESAIGQLVGDSMLQLDGRADKAEGESQNRVGTLKDTLKS